MLQPARGDMRTFPHSLREETTRCAVPVLVPENTLRPLCAASFHLLLLAPRNLLAFEIVGLYVVERTGPEFARAEGIVHAGPRLVDTLWGGLLHSVTVRGVAQLRAPLPESFCLRDPLLMSTLEGGADACSRSGGVLRVSSSSFWGSTGGPKGRGGNGRTRRFPLAALREQRTSSRRRERSRARDPTLFQRVAKSVPQKSTFYEQVMCGEGGVGGRKRGRWRGGRRGGLTDCGGDRERWEDGSRKGWEAPIQTGKKALRRISSKNFLEKKLIFGVHILPDALTL